MSWRSQRNRRVAADMALPGPRFAEHPLRRQLVGEMQLRRVPTFTLPAHMLQLVRIVDAAQRGAEATALAAMPGAAQAHDRHGAGQVGQLVRTSWERHSEATTATVVMTQAAALPLRWTGGEDGEGSEAATWAETLPGAVVRATRTIVVDDEAQGQAIADTAGFAPSHLVTCHVEAGPPGHHSVRIWSDFRIHADGYGRMVVAANRAMPGDLARCVQRLQELGNYRNLALLGLAVTRASWSELDRLEGAIQDVAQDLTQARERDDDLLATLTQLSAQLLSIGGGSGYRLSATAAYARIVVSRLAELRVTPIAGYQSLDDFTERRFLPAVRTCAALTERLALVDGRAAQCTALLRTRIETHIENQNARLLTSMDRSARMQLQLQHLVEGLSVVAISYYCVGLLSYLVKAAEKHWPALPATLLLGAMVPVVAASVLWFMRRARGRLVSGDKHAATGA